MSFEKFARVQQKHLVGMTESHQHLFKVNVDKDELWDTYLNSFRPEDNPIYRERTEHDCSCCRHFVKNFGGVVAISDGSDIITAWDFNVDGTPYEPVVKALAKLVRKAAVKDVFFTKFNGFGAAQTYENLEDGSVHTWNHMHITLPSRFVHTRAESVASKMSHYRDTKNVFGRSLREISLDSIETVLELISSNSLYRGDQWKQPLTEIKALHKQFHNLPEKKQNNYLWAKSVVIGPALGRIKNHSIGTLLMDITNGVDLDKAVSDYERMVAPTNYKRPKAIFTKKMVEEAQKKIEDMGFMESLGRRYAMLDDITMNNILFANRDATKSITGDVFADLKDEVKTKAKKFDRLEKIPIDKFVSDVLPDVEEMEALVQNKHTPNLVSLIAPKKAGSKSMFKWDNNFSWAYNGNITDSMKERVKSAGGKVDGVLRFSIQWNEDGNCEDDFDAHCIEPGGNEIFFGTKTSRISGGQLDVDIIHPDDGQVAVENITWADTRRMRSGEYQFYVHNYTNRRGRGGFRAEIEFDGQIHSFDYAEPLRDGQKVSVGVVSYSPLHGFKMVRSMPSTMSSKQVWGVKTEEFVPVSVCMHSPNYWDDQKGIGNKHYFFMLQGCKNDDRPNGFFNEFMNEELMPHKRVFEALGSKMRVDEQDDQLSGLGFSSTKRAALVMKLKGKTERMVELTF